MPKPKTGKMVSCNICNKLFWVYRYMIKKGHGRFCSRQCADKGNIKPRTIIKCSHCNKLFEVIPSMVVDKRTGTRRQYCSEKCRYGSIEFIEKMRSLNAMQQKIKINNLETTGYAMLDSLGLHYEKQYLINGKICVDACIVESKIIIQFDGDYWHGNPNKFKTLDKRQTRRSTYDKSQDAYLTKCAYKIIRFWESEIRHNPNDCYQRLKNFCYGI